MFLVAHIKWLQRATRVSFPIYTAMILLQANEINLQYIRQSNELNTDIHNFFGKKHMFMYPLF